MIHPEQVAEMFKTSHTQILPTATSTSTGTPGPIPTVIPNPIQWEVLGEVGHRTLWVTFAIMLGASGLFTLLSWNVPTSRRLYYYLTTMLTIVGALSYFAQASGHAASYKCNTVTEHHNHGLPDTYHEACRQIYWGRYVDWALTTPLILLNLCLLAGVDGAHTLMAITADVIMVLAGLFSAYGNDGTAQKWGWYAISCVAYLFVIWHVAIWGSQMASTKGAGVSRLFGSLALFSFAVWTAYPIVWGIAEGAHKTTVDTEILIYAVLDTLAKVVFGLWLLVSHRAMPETNIELGGWWSNGLAADGRIRIGDDE